MPNKYTNNNSGLLGPTLDIGSNEPNCSGTTRCSIIMNHKYSAFTITQKFSKEKLKIVYTICKQLAAMATARMPCQYAMKNRMLLGTPLATVVSIAVANQF